MENRGHPEDFPGPAAVGTRLEEANNARGVANPRALPTRPVIPGGGEGGAEGVRPHHRRATGWVDTPPGSRKFQPVTWLILLQQPKEHLRPPGSVHQTLRGR